VVIAGKHRRRNQDGGTLALRAHSARFRSLRQQPFNKVQPFLRLAQLLPQLGHLGFEHFEPAHISFEPFEPSLELAPPGRGRRNWAHNPNASASPA